MQGNNSDACKLAWTPPLLKKEKEKLFHENLYTFPCEHKLLKMIFWILGGTYKINGQIDC